MINFLEQQSVMFLFAILLRCLFSYDVPAECLNTETGEVEEGKVLRVMEVNGREIIVTVSNMDGDGYLAIPDDQAGM